MMQLFTLRNALVAAAIGLIAAFGYETDWGDAFSAPPIPTRQTAAKHDSAAVLPDFRLSSEANAYSQITERPLLNPSRKPAPTQAPVAAATEPPKPQIRRGLYGLVGVTEFDGSRVAQVRELATGRLRSIRVGDRLQELLVKQIDSDAIVLTFNADSEKLMLPKFTASGRVPQLQPQPQPQPQAPSPVAPQPATAAALPAQPPSPAVAANLPQPATSDVPPAPANLPPGAMYNPNTGAITMPSQREVANSVDVLERRRQARLNAMQPPR
jgi:hypothetical protein